MHKKRFHSAVNGDVFLFPCNKFRYFAYCFSKMNLFASIRVNQNLTSPD